MKRQALITKIGKAARAALIIWELDRQGANHEIWRCGAIQVSIPRHRDINPITAEGICKYLENELGEDWWR